MIGKAEVERCRVYADGEVVVQGRLAGRVAHVARVTVESPARRHSYAALCVANIASSSSSEIQFAHLISSYTAGEDLLPLPGSAL